MRGVIYGFVCGEKIVRVTMRKLTTSNYYYEYYYEGCRINFFGNVVRGAIGYCIANMLNMVTFTM